MDNKNELFPLVNEDGQVLGSITRGKAHDGSKLLHPVVHLHLFNRHGQLYLQKRPEWKDIQPGRWDTAVGGHADCGETPEEAMRHFRSCFRDMERSEVRRKFLGLWNILYKIYSSLNAGTSEGIARPLIHI